MTRTHLALFTLALGGFGIGSSEFGAMGLLPQIAGDLLARTYEADPELAVATGGAFVSLYALGVVIGAPIAGALAARFARRPVLLTLLAGMFLCTVGTALAPTFEIALVFRLASALPHAAFFGVAALSASAILGPGKRASGVAYVLGGLTIANILGVPVMTWIGQAEGWRVSYIAVALVFLAAGAGAAALLPRGMSSDELAQSADGAGLGGVLRNRVLWAALSTAAIASASIFAAITYVAPISTDYTGMGTALVPLVMILIGVGMTIGNYVGGWLGDRSVGRAYLLTFALTLIGVTIILLVGRSAIGLVIGLMLVGTASGVLAPCSQVTLIEALPANRTLASSLNSACLNVGSVIGASLGGLTIALGLGLLSPVVTAALLLLPAVALSIMSGYLALRRPLAQPEG